MTELQLRQEASVFERLRDVLFENKVMLVFVVLCFGAFMVSGSPAQFVVSGVLTRIARNSFTVLALLIPVLAGMGLNFGIVIGAIATQVAVFWTVYWGYGGFKGILLVLAMATPLAILFGYLVGKLFNQMKGAEMIAGLILGYFADGLYQLFFLVIIGGVIPVKHPRLIISGGVGVKNTIDLSKNLKYAIDNVRMLDILTVVLVGLGLMTLGRLLLHAMKKRSFTKEDLYLPVAFGLFYATTYLPRFEAFLLQDRLMLLHAFTIGVSAFALRALYQLLRKQPPKPELPFKASRPIGQLLFLGAIFAGSYHPAIEELLFHIRIPVFPFLLIAGLCYFNTWILKTRIGQNMRTVGQSQAVATASGIHVDQTRIIAMIISTVLASWGQLIYLQSIGTFSTYGAHTQVGQFAIAALLVGGASVAKANNRQAIIGVLLFHTLFIVAPQAGKQLFNNAQIGEYFRVFVSYGVIALSLAMHAWTRIKTAPSGKAAQASG